MKVYAVGGSIRDQLLGLEVRDHDYVVVGSTPEEMQRLGYKPVGKDFPVFLHPETHEQYALARTERKSGHGYRGFTVYASPDVSLEQDLQRRDLTVNAIARDKNGDIIDPFNGCNDLHNGILRHVSPAFAEDPVRVLRVARFAARFGFQIAEETSALMHRMVTDGETDHLVPERVWQEISTGLMEQTPSIMFQVLHQCGALRRVLPEIDTLFGVPQPKEYHPEIDTGIHVMMAIDYGARQQFSLPVRFAALTHDLGKGVTPPEQWPTHHGHEHESVALVESLCTRLRVPGDCRDVAYLTARFHGDIHRALQLRPSTILKMLTAADIFRKPARFEDVLRASECNFRGRTGFEEKPFPQSDWLRTASHAAIGVDAGEIARYLIEPVQIKEEVAAARLVEISKAVEALQREQ